LTGKTAPGARVRGLPSLSGRRDALKAHPQAASCAAALHRPVPAAKITDHSALMIVMRIALSSLYALVTASSFVTGSVGHLIV